MVPAQSHSPSPSASCTSRRPSSSQTFIFRAKGSRAEVLGPRSAEHRTAQGKGRGAGGGGGRGACRGGRLGRHSRRIRFHEVETSLEEKLSFFLFFLKILCNVTSPAPWRSSGERRFLMRREERARCQLQPFLEFLHLGSSPRSLTSTRPSVILQVLMGSYLTIIIQMSPALSGRAVMLCKKCPLSISACSQVCHLRLRTRPLPSAVFAVPLCLARDGLCKQPCPCWARGSPLPLRC